MIWNSVSTSLSFVCKTKGHISAETEMQTGYPTKTLLLLITEAGCISILLRYFKSVVSQYPLIFLLPIHVADGLVTYS